MLRCPKCSRVYQAGTQRFCLHDNGRLQPVAESSGSFGVGTKASEAADDSPNLKRDFAINSQKSNEGFGFAASRPAVVETEETSEWQPRRSTGRLTLRTETSQPNSIETIEIEENPATENVVLEIEPPIQSDFTKVLKPKVQSHHSSKKIEVKPAAVAEAAVKTHKSQPFTAHNIEELFERKINNRYLVEKLISQNASSVTYLGRDEINNQLVSVKVLIDEASQNPNFKQNFYEEKNALPSINHPSIVSILAAGELDEGNLFIVSEYVEGRTLRSTMQLLGHCSPPQAGRIVKQIAQALTEAHNRRLLHRNLTPEKIILKSSESGAEQVKVTDFGLGTVGEIQMSEMAYIAPEVFNGEPLSPESNIFSLGVIAYEMLTGHSPFSDDGAQINLPPAVEAVLQKATAENRAERFRHAREFGEAFNSALVEPAAETSEQIAVSPAANTATGLTERLSFAKAEERLETIEETEIEKNDKAEAILNATNTRFRERRAQKSKFGLPFVVACLLGSILLIFVIDTLLLNSTDGNATIENQPVAPIASTQNPNSVAVPNTGKTANAQSAAKLIAFQNSKENLRGKLAQNYVYFSLKYPSAWKANPKEGTGDAENFLDVANRVSNGLPLEQLTVSWYESKGTFAADRADFPKIAQQIVRNYAYNKTTGKGIPDIRQVSEGEIMLNGHKAYEVKYEGESIDDKNQTIKIWGRTIFLPVERDGARSGLTITMLATSLAPALTNVNDLGVKGELPKILETFAPDSVAPSGS